MSQWVRTNEWFFRLDESPTCPLLGGPVPVEIHTGGDDIRPDQLEALARFQAIPADRRPSLFGPLFADYRTVRSAIGEGPQIGGPGEVWSFVRWYTVLVPRQGPTGHRFVFLQGDPAWEVEHGVELLFRDEQLVHVGRVEGDYGGRFWERLGHKPVESADAPHQGRRQAVAEPVAVAEWLECANPTRLMQCERIAATERKFRLFAVACCRRVPALNSDATLAAVVETIERFADRLATEEELRDAHLRADSAYDAAGETADECEAAEGLSENTVRWQAIHCAARAAYWASLPGELRSEINYVLSLAADAVGLALAGRDYVHDQVEMGSAGERAVQADLVRDIFGNPFCLVTVEPRWLSSDVLGLARGIYEDGAFERVPLLADALMDAGCADEQVLGHCRGSGPHARGCWVVDLVLGKE